MKRRSLIATLPLAAAALTAAAPGHAAATTTAVTLKAPAALVPSGASAGFSGTVSGASAVQVAVQDRNTRLWWRSDGTWGDQQRFAATVSGGAWSYAWTPPVKGDYGVQVFATGLATLPYGSFSALDLGTGTAAALATAGPVRVGTATTLTGLAGAASGVSALLVSVRDPSTGRWWDGSAWAAARASLAATLASPGAKVTSWTLSWTPPADGSYEVHYVAKDAAGTQGTDPAATVTADGTPPAATITGAQDASAPAGRPITWEGVASDDRGVTDVYAAVQDRTTKLWWHSDGTWGAFARYPVTLTGPVGNAAWTVTGGRWSFRAVGWQYSWTPPAAGSYGLQITPLDAAGQPAATLPWLRFTATAATADTTPPQAAFTAPRAGRTLAGGPVLITGTATDDVGVTAVYVGIQNRATGLWWQPGGGWGAYKRLTPAVDGQYFTYEWTPPGDGSYLAHVEAFDAAGNVASAPAGGRPSVLFSVKAGTAYTTLILARSQWTSVDAGCGPLVGSVPLSEVAAELHRRGIAATGSVVGNRTGDATQPGGRTCTPGFANYATWADLAALRDTDGMTFVSHGATYADMTALSADAQRAESCGSLDALAAHGHTRAWGLFAYPNNAYTTAVQQTVVSTCFAYGRVYGTGRNTKASTASPFFQNTWSWPSGHCADPALTCAVWTGTGDATTYTSPYAIAAAASGGDGEWSVVQGYRFVRGRRIAATGPQWDCTGTDWRSHWVGGAELYCYSDLLTALDHTHATTFTDPATVATAWSRTP